MIQNASVSLNKRLKSGYKTLHWHCLIYLLERDPVHSADPFPPLGFQLEGVKINRPGRVTKTCVNQFICIYMELPDNATLRILTTGQSTTSHAVK